MTKHTLRSLNALKNNEGLTLKNYKPIAYKTGYQVADHGFIATSAKEAAEMIDRFNGNCGVWLENGKFYVDHSFRVSSKKEAVTIGRANNQISILSWSDMKLIYC